MPGTLFRFDDVGGVSKAVVGAGGVVLFETLMPRGHGTASHQDYVVSIVHDDVVASANWHGVRYPRGLAPAGTVTFIPAGSKVEGVAEGECRQTSLVLKQGLFDAIAEQANFNPSELRYTALLDPVALKLAQSMAQVVGSDEYRDWPMLVESVSHSLSAALVAQLSPDASALIGREYGGLDDVRKRRLIDYIDANIHRQITLDELAGVSAMSKFHFARCFKKSFGSTPLQYVSDLRVKQARKLLISSALSLSEIAHFCGFASQSHMNTVFKAAIGVTPGGYRRGFVDA